MKKKIAYFFVEIHLSLSLDSSLVLLLYRYIRYGYFIFYLNLSSWIESKYKQIKCNSMNKYLEYFMQERKRERELELKFVGFRKSQFLIIFFSFQRLFLFFFLPISSTKMLRTITLYVRSSWTTWLLRIYIRNWFCRLTLPYKSVPTVSSCFIRL